VTEIPGKIPRRTAGEWNLRSSMPYENPFVDVMVEGKFVSPSGATFTVPGFYDGEATWRLRFNPGEAGEWRYEVSSCPPDHDLTLQGSFTVTRHEGRGFLQATPDRGWGFQYESGEPVFLLGDTVYNLFGMAHCGADVSAFLKRRARQGFNIIRVRLPVSSFHFPGAYSVWQTRSTWPWGGCEQYPLFDRFNLDYFGTVDRIVRVIEGLGLGLEMIMEAWGFEFPFNSRTLFVPEWEELWLRYLIARYDAFNCVHFWTLMNEYECYPDGSWNRSRHQVEDRWAMRMARWVKRVAQHGHNVAVHNGPRLPPFAERFAADPEAIDAIMYQEWGSRDAEDGWLAAGIEDIVQQALDSWQGSAVFAEYGYERNPDLAISFPYFEYCDAGHTRRGAWRGAFCALGVINGFENTWAPYMILDQDQPGLEYLLHMHRFFTEVVPFHQLRCAPKVLGGDGYAFGCRPLVLATPERDVVAVYLPAGGAADLVLPQDVTYCARWYDPRTGELCPAEPATMGENRLYFVAPGGQDQEGHPWDWVLLLSAKGEAGSPAAPDGGDLGSKDRRTAAPG